VMWSMWNAPSDRDYYEQFRAEEERCMGCGARPGEACEEGCDSRRLASLREVEAIANDGVGAGLLSEELRRLEGPIAELQDPVEADFDGPPGLRTMGDRTEILARAGK